MRLKCYAEYCEVILTNEESRQAFEAKFGPKPEAVLSVYRWDALLQGWQACEARHAKQFAFKCEKCGLRTGKGGVGYCDECYCRLTDKLERVRALVAKWARWMPMIDKCVDELAKELGE